MKYLLLVLAPIAVFGFLYPMEIGCFICFDGNARGSAGEAAINVGLAVTVVAIAALAIWRPFKSQD